MTEIKAKLGQKMSDDEQKKVEHAHIGRTTLKPNLKSGASGQSLYQAIVVCPYCGTAQYITESSNVYNYYSCAGCGNTFKA